VEFIFIPLNGFGMACIKTGGVVAVPTAYWNGVPSVYIPNQDPGNPVVVLTGTGNLTAMAIDTAINETRDNLTHLTSPDF